MQGALIWNISPLMSSAQPPVMYTTSLWSHPYEEGAPVRLLQAQERSFLRDLRAAMDKRIDNKIASARRFAVSVTKSGMRDGSVWEYETNLLFLFRCAYATMPKWSIAI